MLCTVFDICLAHLLCAISRGGGGGIGKEKKKKSEREKKRSCINAILASTHARQQKKQHHRRCNVGARSIYSAMGGGGGRGQIAGTWLCIEVATAAAAAGTAAASASAMKATPPNYTTTKAKGVPRGQWQAGGGKLMKKCSKMKLHYAFYSWPRHGPEIHNGRE